MDAATGRHAALDAVGGMPGAFFEQPHRPALADGLVREGAAISVILGEEQCTPVARGESAVLEELEHVVGQVQKAKQVRDGDPAAADAAPDVLACELELLDEGRDRACLLDGIEILAG